MVKKLLKHIIIPVFVLLLVFFSNSGFSDNSNKHSHDTHATQAHNTPITGHNEKQHNAEHETANQHNATHATEKFNPGSYIIDHIVDAYSWHIFTWKGKHVSVPLPVILYSHEQGLVVFSSAKFHHGHSTYKNFEIAQGGEHDGKIIEHNASGEVLLPLDFSITKNVTALLFSVVLICWMFISIANSYKRNPKSAPKGMQSFLEPIIIFIRDDIAKASIGSNYKKYLPFLLSIFFFIWINNLLGLIPIFPAGANLTGNITVTLVLALFTFGITTFRSNKDYWVHIFWTPGVPWWLKVPIPLMPIIELTGIFIKPFVLMLRLFANITAGHIIALGFFSLIFIFGEISPGIGYGASVLSVAFALFMFMLELLVALIQAYVFTLLSAIYFGMSAEEHH